MSDSRFFNMLPEQPPPNAPAPPPSEAAKRSRRSYHIIWGVGIASLLLLLVACLTAPLVFRSRKINELTEAVNNAREIHKVLFEFDVKYGGFPSASTIPKVQSETSTTMPLGSTSSNDYFRQLLATGLGNEKMFYSKSRKSRKPDDLFDGMKALQKGECGFAYVVGLSTSENSSTPLLIAPVISDTKQFDPEPLKGKAVVLRIDGSARSYTIRKDGKIDLGKGDLLDSAKPEWKGKPLTIAWPE